MTADAEWAEWEESAEHETERMERAVESLQVAVIAMAASPFALARGAPACLPACAGLGWAGRGVNVKAGVPPGAWAWAGQNLPRAPACGYTSGPYPPSLSSLLSVPGTLSPACLSLSHELIFPHATVNAQATSSATTGRGPCARV